MSARALARATLAAWCSRPLACLPAHAEAFVEALAGLAALPAAAQPAAPSPSSPSSPSRIALRGPLGRRLAWAREFGLEVADADEIAAALDAATGEVELLIDSPGGAVDAVDPVLQAITRARARGTRVVARVEALAASAAYWIAAAADRIVASQRFAEVGGVGAFAVLADRSAALAERGIRLELISSGGVKGAGADGRITEAWRAEAQRQIDEIAAQFVASLRVQRAGVSVEPDGRTYYAPAALRRGLIDDYEDAMPTATAAATLDAARKLLAEYPEHAARIAEALAAGEPTLDALREELARRRDEAQRAALERELAELRERVAKAEAAAAEAQKRAEAEAKARAEAEERAKRVAEFARSTPADPGDHAPGLLTPDEFAALRPLERAAYVRQHGARFRTT